MKRNVDINAITDGKKYNSSDMVKADCLGCAGCSHCCHDMGNSIVLDPLDVYNLTKGLNTTFEMLLQNNVSLSMIDGIVLPSLKMNASNNGCSFLDENGRCTVHAFRPGICRLFPLGRLYEDRGFSYVLQTGECLFKHPAKTKIKKLLEVPNISEYEQFVNTWHYFLKDFSDSLSKSDDEIYIRNASTGLLKHFFFKEYDFNTDFYTQFKQRMQALK